MLQNNCNEYENQIVASLSRQLVDGYGKGFANKSIRRMMQFSNVFSDERIVVSVIRQLSSEVKLLQQKFQKSILRTMNKIIKKIISKVQLTIGIQ